MSRYDGLADEYAEFLRAHAPYYELDGRAGRGACARDRYRERGGAARQRRQHDRRRRGRVEGDEGRLAPARVAFALATMLAVAALFALGVISASAGSSSGSTTTASTPAR